MILTKLTAAKILQILFVGICVFHALVLLKIVPHTVVWGGKFSTYKEVVPLEFLSLFLNLAFLYFVHVAAKRIVNSVSKPADRILFWFMAVLFGLNTIGNLFAETTAETWIATPITFVMALLALRLAVNTK